jgi:hypothetical protein
MRRIGSFRFDVWERYGDDAGTIRMSQRYQSFREFYPFYLSEHANPACRRMHFVGTTLVVVFLSLALFTRNAWWLAGALVAGYGFAWIGHFFFEHNRPATFTYPIYSLIGDWVMFKDLLTGKIRF